METKFMIYDKDIKENFGHLPDGTEVFFRESYLKFHGYKNPDMKELLAKGTVEILYKKEGEKTYCDYFINIKESPDYPHVEGDSYWTIEDGSRISACDSNFKKENMDLIHILNAEIGNHIEEKLNIPTEDDNCIDEELFPCDPE